MCPFTLKVCIKCFSLFQEIRLGYNNITSINSTFLFNMEDDCESSESLEDHYHDDIEIKELDLSFNGIKEEFKLLSSCYLNTVNGMYFMY